MPCAEHIAERYELIVLIFMGEMVFAATTPGSWSLSLCTVFVFVSIFLLYFVCRPWGKRQLAWSVS